MGGIKQGLPGVGALVFFLCHLFYATPQKFSNFYATLFYATPWNFYATPLYATPQVEMFMPPFFMPPWIFLSFKEKFEIQDGKSTFSTHFFYRPRFFYATTFYATLKKIEIFMPPPFYATLKILMPPFLCHPGGGIKKRGGGWHKKKKPMPHTARRFMIINHCEQVRYQSKGSWT